MFFSLPRKTRIKQTQLAQIFIFFAQKKSQHLNGFLGAVRKPSTDAMPHPGATDPAKPPAAASAGQALPSPHLSPCSTASVSLPPPKTLYVYVFTFHSIDIYVISFIMFYFKCLKFTMPIVVKPVLNQSFFSLKTYGIPFDMFSMCFLVVIRDFFCREKMNIDFYCPFSSCRWEKIVDTSCIRLPGSCLSTGHTNFP